MIRSVARHCEPPDNWTLPSSAMTIRTDEPHLLNGPVSSRIISTAVFCQQALTWEDTGCRVSDSLKSTRWSAERRQMFEATRSPAVATAKARDDRHQTSPQKSSNRRLSYSSSQPGNREAQAVPSREIQPSKNNCKTSPHYRYVLLDLQGHTDVQVSRCAAGGF